MHLKYTKQLSMLWTDTVHAVHFISHMHSQQLESNVTKTASLCLRICKKPNPETGAHVIDRLQLAREQQRERAETQRN